MAGDNRSVTITLKLDTGSGSTSEQEKATDTGAVSKQTDNNSQAKSLAAFAVSQMSQIATSEIVQWSEFFWNRDLVLKDDYIGQRNLRIATTQINRTIGAAGSVASFTAAGNSILPGVGAIIGAAVGLATSISSIINSNIQGQLNQDLSLKQMDAQLDFTRSRAGWSINAASIGEDL